MKICKIYIKGFQQFQDVELDFTNPETGEPVEKVCFIGSNGTGKSKLLGIIHWAVKAVLLELNTIVNGSEKKPKGVGYNSAVIYKRENNKYYLFFFISGYFSHYEINDIDAFYEKNFIEFALNPADRNTKFHVGYFTDLTEKGIIKEVDTLYKYPESICIYSPAESAINDYLNVEDVPETNVDEALKLNITFPFFSEVSNAKVRDFWKLLVYLIRKRDDERSIFERRPENLKKTKQELLDEFDSKRPNILDRLAIVWNKILSKAGLEFDVSGANNPIQLSDNLKVYVQIAKTKKHIPYNELSTGIRNYIFRIGHIYSLYFSHKIESGVLLIDEPENSLYPDFLLDLIDIFKECITDNRGQNNTQMFFATHSPIIAAQFKPYERIILEWNEDGSVRAHKGQAPEGDDPNDVLMSDFGLTEVMGKAGVAKWREYLDKMEQLSAAKGTEEKMKLSKEISDIGRLYKFPAV